MNQSTQQKLRFQKPLEVFTASELRGVAEHIRDSGVLGRSSVYATLLDYLVECSLQNRSPKEIEIAIEALGKGADFDVSRDSSVRVYIHQLRKKLDRFYEAHESQAPYQIAIPKGQYAIAATSTSAASAPRSLMQRVVRIGLTRGLMAALIVVLFLNLFALLYRAGSGSSVVGAELINSPIWNGFFDDEIPIMIVMGDYYIFGELNERGNIGRMVRDFNINSPEDLEERHFNDWETTRNYQDLDLSYMPEGSAYALTRIIPLLNDSEKMVRITMMSDLSTADLRENHIVYIGYISALDKLTDMAFAASGLRIGRSYDELLNLKTGRYYTSDAGLPGEGEQFRDYGFFSTFPASSENQVLIVGGMRDAGLMYTAQTLSDPNGLTELEQSRSRQSSQTASLEALYEVFGVDRTQFNGRMVYSNDLDAGEIWGSSLSRVDDSIRQ